MYFPDPQFLTKSLRGASCTASEFAVHMHSVRTQSADIRAAALSATGEGQLRLSLCRPTPQSFSLFARTDRGRRAKKFSKAG